MVENKSDIDKFAQYQPEEETTPSAKPSEAPPKSPTKEEAETSASSPPEKPKESVPTSAQQEQASDPHKVNDRVLASPAAKVIAASKGIALEKVVGTGPGGRILKSDVESYGL